MYGVRLSRKSIDIKQFYRDIGQYQDRLKSSWTVFDSIDINKLEYIKIFEDEINKINDEFKEHICDAGLFGKVIDIKFKKNYEKRIQKLVDECKKYLRKEKCQIFNQIDKDVNITEVINNSKNQLINYLSEVCPDYIEIQRMVAQKGDFPIVSKKEVEKNNELLKKVYRIFC